MRILEMITPSKIGGAETYFAATISQLRAQDEEVEVWCPAGRPIVEYLLARGIRPITWKTTGKIDPVTLCRLVALIKSRRIDIVHTHLSTASLYGALAAGIARTPCLATVHGLGSARWYRLAHQVIAVSRAVKEHLIAQGIPADRIAVVHNGVDPSLFTPSTGGARAYCGLQEDEFIAGIFGRLAPEKGQDIALRAWPEVLRRLPRARLLLVGDGKQRESLMHLASELGIAGQVDFLGFLPDPRQLLHACDVVLCPSRKEGLGLAALEAMASGKPVIASVTGGLREVIVHREDGLLVPSEDPATLAQAVCALAGDPILSSRLAANGRQRVLEQFTLSRQIEALRRHFQDAFQARHPLVSQESRVA